MTYLKSSNSNDKIKYEIGEESIMFTIEVLEHEKQIKKLVKYLLLQLNQEKCTLPIKLEVNDYIHTPNMDIKVDENPKREYRFFITVLQQDFQKF